MSEQLTLMCLVAHPDDESLGFGGILAKYAAEGVETSLVMATRGEAGWHGPAAEHPGPVALGQMREAELRAAARTLGVRDLAFLDYCDGELDQADPAAVIASITGLIRQMRPQVVVTFAPDGSTGHPDHIAISQLATAAMVCAADPSYPAAWDWPSHRVSKLYYVADTSQKIAAFEAVFGESAMQVDGVRRTFAGWPDWAITTRIDAADHWQQVWQAIRCHRSQLPGYEALLHITEDQHRYLWGCQEFYRAFSLVNAGRAVEDDLFAGLR